MSQSSKPTNIEELLSAAPKDLQDWSSEVELVEPEIFQAEEDLAQVWLKTEHKEIQEETASFWWQRLFSQSFTRSFLFPMATVAAVMALFLWVEPEPEEGHGLQAPPVPRQTLPQDKGMETPKRPIHKKRSFPRKIRFRRYDSPRRKVIGVDPSEVRHTKERTFKKKSSKSKTPSRFGRVYGRRPKMRDETFPRGRPRGGRLYPKGKAHDKSKGRTGGSSAGPQYISLFVGVPASKNKKVERLRIGETVTQKQVLLFGFQLKRSGYLYLLVKEEKKGKTILYPFQKGFQQKWSKGFSLFTTNGIPQEYTLENHLGKVVFLAVLTSEPLSRKWLKSLQKELIRKVLKDWKKGGKERWGGMDQFRLKIKKR